MITRDLLAFPVNSKELLSHNYGRTPGTEPPMVELTSPVFHAVDVTEQLREEAY